LLKGTVNYFDIKLTNGILEGINSKIQLAKRRARGFRNIKNLINMIRLIGGKIKFKVQDTIIFIFFVIFNQFYRK